MFLQLFKILNFAYFFATLIDYLRILILNGFQIDISLKLIRENEIITDPILLKLIKDHRKDYDRFVILALPWQVAFLND